MSDESSPRRRVSDYEPQAISKAELRDIFEESARRIIHETFDNIGVDLTSPEARHEIRDDFSWLRSVRRGSADAAKTVRSVGLVTLVGAVLTSVGLGIKAKLGGP
jgi:hypothetical protein